MSTTLVRAQEGAPDRSGDARAFQALYEQEFDFVWKVVRRLGASERDLPDVVHDVFVTAYRRLPSYDASRPLRPWLFGIAFRVLSGYRRRDREAMRSEHEPDALQNQAPAPDERLIEHQQRVLVHEILAALTPERRAVLIAHEIEELPMGALARELDVPVKTLYSRLRAAREDFVAAMRRRVLRGQR